MIAMHEELLTAVCDGITALMEQEKCNSEEASFILYNILTNATYSLNSPLAKNYIQKCREAFKKWKSNEEVNVEYIFFVNSDIDYWENNNDDN